jgi:hypothetical protein
MKKTPTQKLIDYTVVHANGKSYNIFLPKMSQARLRAALEMDAKSDGTTVKSFKENKAIF